jgi:WD40 repeat protein
VIDRLKLGARLRTADAVQAERVLAASLSGKSRDRLIHAFRLSSSALKEHPEEWPTQLIARLQGDKDSAVRSVVASIAESREGCWLEPIRAPLVPAGSPITRIIDAETPYMNGRMMVWSNDRRRITSFCRTAFRTWDISANREVSRLELPIEWGRAAISNPPRTAIVAVAQRQILLVNLKNATATQILNGAVIESIAISADGRWAVATSVPPDWDYFEHEWDGPRTFHLFDLRRRRCVRTWQDHSAVITDLALSATGEFLATTSRDKSARLYDLRKGQTLGHWISRSRLTAVAITPSGHRVAYVSERRALTVRTRNGYIVARHGRVGAADPGCLALSANGRRAVLAGGGWVSVVDVRSGKRYDPDVATQPYLDCLAIDAEARNAITGENSSQLIQWDLTKVRKVEQPYPWISGIWAGASEALVHAGRLSLWNLSTGKSTEIFSSRNFQSAAAPSANRWAVATWAPSSGGRIRIGNWGRKQTTALFSTPGLVNGLEFSRSGSRLAASVHLAPNQTELRVIDLISKQTVWQSPNVPASISSHLSPSGRYLALCSLRGGIEVVDLDTKIVHDYIFPNQTPGGSYLRLRMRTSFFSKVTRPSYSNGESTS